MITKSINKQRRRKPAAFMHGVGGGKGENHTHRAEGDDTVSLGVTKAVQAKGDYSG